MLYILVHKIYIHENLNNLIMWIWKLCDRCLCRCLCTVQFAHVSFIVIMAQYLYIVLPSEQWTASFHSEWFLQVLYSLKKHGNKEENYV